MPLDQRPLSSPFNAQSTTDDVLRGIDLRGRNAIVTGASAGLGAETARALAKAGAAVTLAVRSTEKGEIVAREIRAKVPNATLDVAYLDLGKWSSVRAFADNVLKRGAPLHLLIDNAGLMPATKELVEGKIEAQFGSNHLGHMLLTCLLVPALLKGAPARVVVLSSAAHRRLPFYFESVADTIDRPYEKLDAYSISKTANALFALEFNRRMEDKGVTATSVNPGAVFTGIQTAFSPDEMKKLNFYDAEGNKAAWFRPVEIGAATTVWCATSPLLTKGGVYCEDSNVCAIRNPAPSVAAPSPEELAGVRPWAADPDNALRCWRLSESLLKETFAL